MVLKNASFFVLKARKSRCFKHKSGEQLGSNYRNRKKDWMTGALLKEWLKKFYTDRKVSNFFFIFSLKSLIGHFNTLLT